MNEGIEEDIKKEGIRLVVNPLVEKALTAIDLWYLGEQPESERIDYHEIIEKLAIELLEIAEESPFKFFIEVLRAAFKGYVNNKLHNSIPYEKIYANIVEQTLRLSLESGKQGQIEEKDTVETATTSAFTSRDIFVIIGQANNEQ